MFAVIFVQLSWLKFVCLREMGVCEWDWVVWNGYVFVPISFDGRFGRNWTYPRRWMQKRRGL